MNCLAKSLLSLREIAELGGKQPLRARAREKLPEISKYIRNLSGRIPMFPIAFTEVYQLVLITLLDKCDGWDALWRTLCCHIGSLLFSRETPNISFATDALHARVVLVAWLALPKIHVCDMSRFSWWFGTLFRLIVRDLIRFIVAAF